MSQNLSCTHAGYSTYLYMSIECSMMQGCPASSIRYIDTTKQRNDCFCTLNCLFGSSHMQGCLPVFVTSIDVSGVLDQNSNCFLKNKFNFFDTIVIKMLQYNICISLYLLQTYRHRVRIGNSHFSPLNPCHLSITH